MGRGEHLGELEALVLTAILRVEHGSNGTAAYREIEEGASGASAYPRCM